MSLSAGGHSRRKNKTNELEDRFQEIMQTEIKTEKKKRLGEKRTEYPTAVVQSNIYVIRIPNEEERKNGAEKKNVKT